VCVEIEYLLFLFKKKKVLLTPWNITSNYVAVMQGKGMFQLTGLGDPTQSGDGFSYMRVAHKSYMVSCVTNSFHCSFLVIGATTTKSASAQTICHRNRCRFAQVVIGKCTAYLAQIWCT
jgi:hypothetical protein